jgi:hypothetical protein
MLAPNKKDEYLILTENGLKFMKKWFGKAKMVPPKLTRLYQLLLHTTSYGGCISRIDVRRIGYKPETVDEAISKGYVVTQNHTKVPKEIRETIAQMRGKVPKILYM